MTENYEKFIVISFEVKLQAFCNIPYQHRFETVYENINGGSIKIHADYQPKEDTDILREIAFEKAQSGNKVEILPELLKNQQELRQILVPDAIGNKNPDLRINGELVEVKATKTSKGRAIKDRLEVAAGQANKVILNLPEPYDEDSLIEILTKKFRKHQNLEMVEIRYKEKYIPYFRKDLKI